MSLHIPKPGGRNMLGGTTGFTDLGMEARCSAIKAIMNIGNLDVIAFKRPVGYAKKSGFKAIVACRNVTLFA